MGEQPQNKWEEEAPPGTAGHQTGVWRGLFLWRFSRTVCTKTCPNSVFTLRRAGAWTEDLLRSLPAPVTLCFVSCCNFSFPMSFV